MPNLLRPALTLLAVVILAVAGVLIWLWVQPVDATDVLEEVCAAAEPTRHFDVVMESFGPDNTFVKERHEFNVAENGMFRQTTWYSRTGTAMEAEVIYLAPTPLPHSSEGRSAVTSDEVLITYTRETSQDGEWGEWVLRELSTGSDIPAVSRGDDDPQIFCGLRVDGFTEFTYDGEETVNGIRTKKFTLVYDPGGHGREHSWWWEHWISLEGRRVQEDWIRPGSVVRSTFSGWGEENIIPSAPVQGSASP